MARLPRLYAPQIPQLALASFAQPLAHPAEPAPAEQLDKLAVWLREVVQEQRATVHGWVLLNDRLALLATPSAPNSMARLIQALGRRYATRLQHGRVFTGRYRSALLQPGQWVLPALLWLDYLPVQAGYIDQPQAWPWSSAAHHTGVSPDPAAWLADHPDYWINGNTPFERQANYRARLAHGLPLAQQQRIEGALFGQWALGDPPFLASLANSASRRVAPAPARPAQKNRRRLNCLQLKIT